MGLPSCLVGLQHRTTWTYQVVCENVKASYHPAGCENWLHQQLPDGPAYHPLLHLTSPHTGKRLALHTDNGYLQASICLGLCQGRCECRADARLSVLLTFPARKIVATRGCTVERYTASLETSSSSTSSKEKA